jgi:hydrogenase-4 component F
MLIWMLLLTPALAGGLAFLLRSSTPRRALLLVAALAHAAMTAALWTHPTQPILEGWIAVDSASIVFLSLTSALFLAASVYAVGYLGQQSAPQSSDAAPHDADSRHTPETVLIGCLLLFLATMTLVVVSRHLGLLWVAVEATTLASAPLICFHRNPRSLEATWKYLLICSVGIALALLGNFFLTVAAEKGSRPIHLTIDALLAHAAGLDPTWLKAAFLLLLVGYGTKMGLAPLHTWLPDAHSEAPSMVSALLSGALLNCALLGILRVHSVLVAAGLGTFSRELLVVFGLFSLGTAVVFILGQADYKRMLAYSSVEHMGVLALGVGIGGLAGFGSLLHAVNHSLAKAMLFLVAGNILAVYRTKSTRDTQGLLKVLPQSGVLWIAGFLAISGSPPFGLFVSEITILKGAIDEGHPLVAAAYLAALALVFVGMATIVLRMAYGQPQGNLFPSPEKTGSPELPPASRPREALWSIAPPAVLGVGVLMLGVYLPPPLAVLLHQAATALGAL